MKARERDEEKVRVVMESLKEGRRGLLRRAENQPRTEAVEGGEGGGRGRWAGRERKEVMVAVIIWVAAEVESSDRGLGVESVAWPKRKPWRSAGEAAERWRSEANVAPEMLTLSIGRSSIL